MRPLWWIGIRFAALALLAGVVACASTTPPDNPNDPPDARPAGGTPDAPPGACPSCSGGNNQCCSIGGSWYCVNTSQDIQNCGTCGKTCEAQKGDKCVGGQCKCGFAPECTGQEKCCDTGCKNVLTDNNNCGDCGQACGTGLACVDGQCKCNGVVCLAGESCCGGLCKNLNTDPQHCGTCDNACTGQTSSCNSGACGCPGGGGACPAGAQAATCCGSGCADICNDLQNCGACGHACTIFDFQCMMGFCYPTDLFLTDGGFNPLCLPLPTP